MGAIQIQNENQGIRMPELLVVRQSGQLYYGANQSWYPLLWQRQAGCGPTVAATLFWYLAQTRADCAPLCAYDGASKSGFLQLMEDVWQEVTPGMGGTTIALFQQGILRYAKKRGVPLAVRVMDIPARAAQRPSIARVLDFLQEAFYRDIPVAFQNYSNGALTNLEAWHWVTLLSVDAQRGMALMYDQGIRCEIDIRLWLETATRSGKFVTVEPDGAALS